MPIFKATWIDIDRDMIQPQRLERMVQYRSGSFRRVAISPGISVEALTDFDLQTGLVAAKQQNSA